MQHEGYQSAAGIVDPNSQPAVGSSANAGPNIETTVAIGDLTIDIEREVVVIGTTPVHLTGTEFIILRTLLMRSSAVIRRDALLSTVRSYTANMSSKSLDGHISRLRSKLGPYGTWIRTFKGIGYRFFPIPPA